MLEDVVVLRPVQVDVRREPVVLRDLLDDLRVGLLQKGDRVPVHAQVLQAVLSEDGQGRRPSFRERRLERADAPPEKHVATDVHHERLTEVELLPVEEQEAGRV